MYGKNGQHLHLSRPVEDSVSVFFLVRQPGFGKMQPPVFRARSFLPLSDDQALIHQDQTARYGHVWVQENPEYDLSRIDEPPSKITLWKDARIRVLLVPD
jgi:hypothetical protein